MPRVQGLTIMAGEVSGVGCHGSRYGQTLDPGPIGGKMKTIGNFMVKVLSFMVLIMMGVTPVHAVFTFRTSRGIKSVDAYISDVANGLVNFDDGIGASATSNTFYNAPENSLLVDVAITTGPTVIGRLMITRNSIPTGNILGIIPHVDTSPLRPQLAIAFAMGSKLAVIQQAL